MTTKAHCEILNKSPKRLIAKYAVSEKSNTIDHKLFVVKKFRGCLKPRKFSSQKLSYNKKPVCVVR